jgi:hypothetical protein
MSRRVYGRGALARGQWSTTEERFGVPAAAQHAKNQYVSVLDPVDDDVLANRKAPQAGTQVLVASAPDIGMVGE